MPRDPFPDHCRTRRRLLAGCALAPLAAWAAAPDPPALLRGGGVVAVFRHALAPGSFEPPGFRPDQCGTQRNLNEEGRRQAARLGAWFNGHGLRPARVRSSPWCRCRDTATIAFGEAETWDALGSLGGHADQDAGAVLRAALAGAARRPGFEVWITHHSVLSILTGDGFAPAEGLVLRADGDGPMQVLARLAPP